MFYTSLVIFTLLCMINTAKSAFIPKRLFPIEPETYNGEIVKLLSSKNYIPGDDELPNLELPKNYDLPDKDTTFVLSKLSDEELLKVLNEMPKEDEIETKYETNEEKKRGLNFNDDKTVKIKMQKYEPQVPVFKLNHKEVDPYAETDDLKYNAYKKIKNILFNHPQEDRYNDSDEKKELLFDILVAQLKSLCCKKEKRKVRNNDFKLLKKQFQSKIAPKKEKKDISINNNLQKKSAKEYIFLVINEEIMANTSDDLILVDPESLSSNSSALLLGPINTPLNESELKLVMSRISNELSRPEYLPLLNKLSDDTLAETSDLINSIITGPETRRYIKPHRCNHQSKLARIYGGPKWLICTGYLNLNTPSIYD